MTSMKKKKVSSFLSSAAVFAWMAVIVSFSLQEGNQSGALSGTVARALYGWVENWPFFTDRLPFDVFHFLLRKGAHFGVYLVLGLLTWNALRFYRAPSLRQYAFVTLGAFIFALVDEGIQYFTPGRVFAVTDVFIDGLGFMTGLFSAVGLAALLKLELYVRKD